MNVTREKSALLSWETRGDDAERLAAWLTTFLGEDVFRRLEENENLHVSMLEEKKDVTGWLTAGLKTILKSEDLELLVQRVEREIQELQKRLIVAEEIQVSNQDITADCERQKREIEALEVKLEPLQREVNSLKKKVAASVGIDVVVDAVFSGEAVEIQTINQLLKEDIKNPSEALSAFCVALAKTWGILARALQKEGEEEEKMEILHAALTRVLEALTGLYIPQRRAVLEQLAKLCNSRVSDYLFISPEESKEIDLRIHNAASIGGNQILEGRTFAVVNRSSYQTVKYAEIEVC